MSSRRRPRPVAPGSSGDGVDVTLGHRLARGDEAALAECYATLGPLVRHHVARLVPGHAVDDVVQVAFLELWRTRRRFDPSRGLTPWVLAIARRRAIDQLRSEARHYRRADRKSVV